MESTRPSASARPQPSPESVAALTPFLAAPTANTPVWLAGGRVAFLSDRGGVPQVWVTDPLPAEPIEDGSGVAVSPLTNLSDRIGALVAAPQGDRIVFGMDHGGDERQQLWVLDVPNGDPAQASEPRALTKDPQTIHAFGAISPDGTAFAFSSNARNAQFFDVATISLTDTAAVPILRFAHDELLYPLEYSPDGSKLLILRTNSNLDHDLFLDDEIGSDGSVPIHLTPHEGEATIKWAAFAPDGQSILVATNQDREFAALVRLDLTGKLLDVIQEPEWDIETGAVSHGSGWIAYVVNDDGISRLQIQTPDGLELDIDGLPPGTIEGLQWSPDGERLAVAISTPVSPGAIWIVENDGRAWTAVPPVYGDLDSTALVQPVIVRFPTFDGREIPVFWSLPLGEGPFPVVVDVHGGPESQRRANWMPALQFLLSQGYAVLSTNVRGSTGYGKTYTHLDDIEKRYDSVRDLEAAQRWLRQQPEVDPDRIAIFGQSYGGFMVLAALTTQPDLWAAGVDVVGIANFETFLANTGPWRRKTRAAEYGDPERDTAVLREISPIHRVDRIRAPLLVIHGRNDPRVPLSETEQIVAALEERGQPVEFMVFDDEGHGLVKRPNRIAGYGVMADFLHRYLGGASAARAG